MKDYLQWCNFNSILHVTFLYNLEVDIHINKQTVALQNIDLIF